MNLQLNHVMRDMIKHSFILPPGRCCKHPAEEIQNAVESADSREQVVKLMTVCPILMRYSHTKNHFLLARGGHFFELTALNFYKLLPFANMAGWINYLSARPPLVLAIHIID